MLWTLLLLNEFDLIFHDDFSTTAERYEGWTLVGDTAQQNLGLVRPGEQVHLDGQGIQQATLRWLDDQANVVGEDPWQKGVPATAPPAARAVGLTLRDSANVSNLSVTVAPPAEDRLAGLGNFERPDGGIEGWSAFNQAIAWEGIGRDGGALRTVGPLNERYGGSGLERRFDVQAGTILHASVFWPYSSECDGSGNQKLWGAEGGVLGRRWTCSGVERSSSRRRGKRIRSRWSVAPSKL